jgi:hypothetical protein
MVIARDRAVLDDDEVEGRREVLGGDPDTAETAAGAGATDRMVLQVDGDSIGADDQAVAAALEVGRELVDGVPRAQQ